MKESRRQFMRFCLVGASNMAVSYIVYALVLSVLGRISISCDYIIANIIAFLLSILWSYYWNDRMVFPLKENGRRNRWKALGKTYLCYGFTGILLANALSVLWINGIGINKYMAPILNVMITTPLNFLIIKRWAFRQ